MSTVKKVKKVKKVNNNKPAAKPNILWVFGDQHRAQATGIGGDPNVHTPNIDRLAAEGVVFPNAVSGCPLCSPYRGALLTGRYPHNSVPGHEYPLPDGMPTIAQPFNDAGYHTAYFGKWHIDGYKEANGRAAFHHVPANRRGGFKQWLGYDNNNSQWDCHVHGHDDKQNEIQRYRLPGFETDVLTDLTCEYFQARQQDDQPFFAVLSAQPPHDPYQAPEEWMGRHTPGQLELRENVPNIPRITQQARRDLAGYYGMIENLDWNLGRIVQKLHETGQIYNTHILFFSDHGDMHGSHGMFKKTCPYEESVRVPMIIGGLGSRYGHKFGQCDATINHVDIGATSLGLAGIEAPEWIEGSSYAARRLAGATISADEPDSAFIQLVVATKHGNSIDRPWRGVITRDGWKYVCLEHQPWLLFNLNEDPYEQVNYAHNTRLGVKRKELHQRLERWIKETGDSFPLPVMA